MNPHLHTTIPSYGFKTEWKICQSLFIDSTIAVTKVKSIDGMPGVKWFLKCNTDSTYHRCNTKYVVFYINISSKAEINYKIDFQLNFQNKDSIISCSTGTTNIELKRIELEEIMKPSNSFFCQGKLKVEVYGTFWHKKESLAFPLICNPEEWKLRLIEKMPQDFEFIVGTDAIKIIKLFVATESDVFERMFEANFTEAKENKATIEGYKFDTVKNSIDYCYGKDISAFIEDQENAIELLTFANQYNFITLKPKLEKRFAKMLSTENIELLASLSDKANALELRQSCVNFVQSLFNTSPKWPNEELPEFDTKFLRDVVTSFNKENLKKC